MTTHRIDTVALAPEDNIFTIIKNKNESEKEKYQIEKTHKLVAMFRMSSNLKELINYHIKVYVESRNDSRFY